MQASSFISRVGFWGVLLFEIYSVPTAMAIFAFAWDAKRKAVRLVARAICAVLTLYSIAGVIICVCGCDVESESSFVVEKEYILESLSVADEIQGYITGGPFIVRAEMSSGPVFRFYYQRDDGSYKLGEIPADGAVTTIYYDDGTPRIEIGRRATIMHYYWFGEPSDDSTNISDDARMEYRVCVPEGSIVKKYQL